MLRKIIRHLGYDVVSYDRRFNLEARKSLHLKALDHHTFLDVGANIGQFGESLRKSGFKGEIHSFEPMAKEFANLTKKCARDASWTAHPFGLGSENKELEIQRTENSFSSSILPSTALNTAANSATAVSATETIQVRVLDEVIAELGLQNRDLAIKLDTQGFEMQVLKGAENALKSTSLLICEMSWKELYQGQAMIEVLIPWLRDRGFVPTVIQPCDENYSNLEILQVDIWYIRAEAP